MPSKILVLGATGYVGTATVAALVAKGVKATLAVRNTSSEKAKKLSESEGISLVKGDMSAPDTLANAMVGVDVVYIITPGAENRAELATAAIDAAKTNNVNHIVVVSVCSTISETDVLFKKQFIPIETATKESGIKYTILRLPMFMDNQWANQGSIQGQGKLYAPAEPAKRLALISCSDIGEASAAVLSAPSKHQDKIYTLIGDNVTHEGIVKTFSDATGKTVDYVKVPYEAAVDAMVGLGFPKWQAGGVAELFELVNGDDISATGETKDLESILSHPPKSFKVFVDEVAAAFK